MNKLLVFIEIGILVLVVLGCYNTVKEKGEKIVQLEYELDWAIAEKLELLEYINELEAKIDDLESQLENK